MGIIFLKLLKNQCTDNSQKNPGEIKSGPESFKTSTIADLERSTLLC